MRQILKLLLAGTMMTAWTNAQAGQAPGSASATDIPISHHDRVYAAEQFSNTVSVSDPVDNKLLGVIRLGDPQPVNFSPLYKGQVLVHGMGYSPDHRTLAIVSIGSNSVTFIDTATNAVKHVTYVGRSPHEAFFTPDGKEIWVTVRGENYISVLDAKNFTEEDSDHYAEWSRHADFLARRKVWLHLLVLQPGDRCLFGRRPQDRSQSEAGKPVLPEHRGDARRPAGMVHTEGHRQDASV